MRSSLAVFIGPKCNHKMKKNEMKEHVSRGSLNERKGCQQGPKWSPRDQSGAKRGQNGAKSALKSTKGEQNGTTRVPKSTKRGAHGAKRAPNGAKREPKSDQNAFENWYQKKFAKSEIPRMPLVHFWSHNLSLKSSKFDAKINTEKASENHEQLTNNGAKINPTINEKRCNFGNESSWFLKRVWSEKLIRGTKNHEKKHRKTMQNRCRKSDAKMNESDKNMSQHGSRNQSQINAKTSSKKKGANLGTHFQFPELRKPPFRATAIAGNLLIT